MKRIIIFILIVFCWKSQGFTQNWEVVGNIRSKVMPIIGFYKSEIYLAGYFNIPEFGSKTYQLVKFDGLNWDTLYFPSNNNTAQNTFGEYSDSLLIGGGFMIKDTLGDTITNMLGYFDYNYFNPHINFNPMWVTHSVQAFQEYKGRLYIGGGGFIIDNQTVRGILSWDGNQWQDVAGGLYSNGGPQVMDMTIYDDKLIAAGSCYKYLNGKTAFDILSWDGDEWNDLDTGIDGIIRALVIDTLNNFLFAGGNFEIVGSLTHGIVTSNVAIWDGEKWTEADSGISNGIISLCYYHKEVYAGLGGMNGSFDDTVLVRFDGERWNRVPGFNDAVVITAYNDTLYASGFWHDISPTESTALVKGYIPPPTGCKWLQARILTGGIDSINLPDSGIVHFKSNNHYAQSWQWDFGDGGNANTCFPVHEYTTTGYHTVRLIVEQDGCLDTAYRTILVSDANGIEEAGSSMQVEAWLGQNVPNPFEGTTEIPYFLPEGKKGLLLIHSNRGEIVKKFQLLPGKSKKAISLDGLKNGIYFYSIESDAVIQTKKMVMAR